MLADQHKLRRRLVQLQNKSANESEWLNLQQQIERSNERFQFRLNNLPKPSLNADLPVIERKEDIAKAIQQHQVIILCGETGSGKTTQLPQICLDLGRGLQPACLCGLKSTPRIPAEQSR